MANSYILNKTLRSMMYTCRSMQNSFPSCNCICETCRLAEKIDGVSFALAEAKIKEAAAKARKAARV